MKQLGYREQIKKVASKEEAWKLLQEALERVSAKAARRCWAIYKARFE